MCTVFQHLCRMKIAISALVLFIASLAIYVEVGLANPIPGQLSEGSNRVRREFDAQSVLRKWKSGEKLTAEEQAVVDALEAHLADRLQASESQNLKRARRAVTTPKTTTKTTPKTTTPALPPDYWANILASIGNLLG